MQEINNEFSRVELVIYRLEVDNITNAILAKFNAGVPVRLIVDPGEYTNIVWPEYWLTHANLDKLWAAGVPMKQRVHQGVTHMKTLVTSTYATNASSNFAAAWQRDHDYFVAGGRPSRPSTRPSPIASRDVERHGGVRPVPAARRPNAATVAAPTSGATGVATTTSLVWNRAAWATSYDVYLGTSQANLTLAANVPAQLVVNPPARTPGRRPRRCRRAPRTSGRSSREPSRRRWCRR